MSQADWETVALLVLLALAIALGFCLGRVYSLNRPDPPTRDCACGCGRRIPNRQGWDGYHG